MNQQTNCPTTKTAYVGCSYWLDSKTLVHCVDINLLSLEARVGVLDENGTIWTTSWVHFSRLDLIHAKKTHCQ